MVFFQLAVLASGLALLYTILHYLKHKLNFENRAPGEIPLPIIGNLHQAAWRTIRIDGGRRQPSFVAMKRISERFGPIASFTYGQLFTVVVDDYDHIKELLNSESWTGRHWDRWFAERSWGRPYGILFSVGEEWKEMRRFIIRTLRDFGFGKNASQELVMVEELNELTNSINRTIEESSGNNATATATVQMKQFFTISVLNVLWSMMTGTRFSHDDLQLKRLNAVSGELIRLTPIGGNICNAFPILTPLFAGKMRPLQRELWQFFWDLLNERRARQDYKSDQTDFVEVFLKEIDNHKGQTPNYYTDEQMVVTLMDLFLAGSETTSNTLEFAILYMIINPEVQEKVHHEIRTVVGLNRYPSVADKQNMPYTEATLLEIQRHANVLPIDSRSAVEDTKLGGYNIRKGTPVFINLHSLHFSPKLWTNPHAFDPTRFLDSSNNIVNANKIMPFGGGKRVCIGESMARLTLFTYFTTLLQRYKFSQLPGGPTPSSEPVLGFTLSPQKYSAHVQLR